MRGSSSSSAAAAGAGAGAEEQAPHGTDVFGLVRGWLGPVRRGIETPVLFRALPEVLDPSPFGGDERGLEWGGVLLKT